MGTNYYLRPKVSSETKNKIKELVDLDKFEEIKDILSQHEDIHIGKQSGGWKFLWDVHYFNYFEPSKEAIIEWLKTGIIFDEYGDKYTLEEFFDNIRLEGTFNGRELLDAVAYQKIDPQAYRYRMFDSWQRARYVEKNIHPNSLGEFYLDNFRCVIDEDFS